LAAQHQLITGQKTSTPMTGLTNQLHKGDIHALADSMNRFFQVVAANISPLDDSITPPPPEIVQSKFIISQADVEYKLSHNNRHKAQGPDGLSNWLLRDFLTHLTGPMCAIYNASVQEGHVPS